MRRVNIYIGTENTILKESERWTAYVLECMVRGETETREDFRLRTGTYNGVVLQTIAEALGRMTEHCEIHIYCPNLLVMNMLPELPKWEKEGYRLKGGGIRKNCEEWKKINQLQQGHLIVPEPGEHPYSGWMEAQMELMREKDNNNQNPDNNNQVFDNRNQASDNRNDQFDNKEGRK